MRVACLLLMWIAAVGLMLLFAPLAWLGVYRPWAYFWLRSVALDDLIRDELGGPPPPA